MVDQPEQEAMVNEVWRRYLVEGEETGAINWKHVFRHLPSDPRCKMCNAPFHGLGGQAVRLVFGRRPLAANPRLCSNCEDFARKYPGGAEIELSMLFADVRGSTALAESMAPAEFSRLIERFLKAATATLVRTDGLLDKLVGDEVVALYVPGMAGPQHARQAIMAAQALLDATGHTDPGGPWIPVGVGVHTGVAYVGTMGGKDGVVDITALGDAVNVTARLASQAGPGELLVSESAIAAAGIAADDAERRRLELKGRSEPISVRVLHAERIPA